jgi:hypothetical protein
MTAFSRRRLAHALTIALAAAMIPVADSAACEARTLVEALSEASATPSRSASRSPVQAVPLPAAELAALPALASTESLLRRVGLPLAWHRIDRNMVDAALDAGGGTLIVAAAQADGGQTECQVLTRDRAGSTPLKASQATVLALLPVQPAAEGFVLQEVVRGMVADFRLAMRVGTQYAPQGAWVISPWLTDARLQRSLAVNTPQPGVKAKADTEVHTTGAGVGLTRGLTRDTSLTLLLAHQQSRIETTTTFPPSIPAPARRDNSRQEDTLLGLGLYSRLVRQDGALPTVLFHGRAFAPSTHSRAHGTAALTPLYELSKGWAISATLGADAERPDVERPETAPSRFGRSATLGASAQISNRWMLTVDAGQRELRGLPGKQSVERLRIYHSFASMSYLALVIDQEGPDRRATLTFARPL